MTVTMEAPCLLLPKETGEGEIIRPGGAKVLAGDDVFNRVRQR